MKAMKLKIQGVLVLFCLVSFQLMAQQSIDSRHTIQMDGPKLTVYQHTFFKLLLSAGYFLVSPIS